VFATKAVVLFAWPIFRRSAEICSIQNLHAVSSALGLFYLIQATYSYVNAMTETDKLIEYLRLAGNIISLFINYVVYVDVYG